MYCGLWDCVSEQTWTPVFSGQPWSSRTRTVVPGVIWWRWEEQLSGQVVLRTSQMIQIVAQVWHDQDTTILNPQSLLNLSCICTYWLLMGWYSLECCRNPLSGSKPLKMPYLIFLILKYYWIRQHQYSVYKSCSIVCVHIDLYVHASWTGTFWDPWKY